MGAVVAVGVVGYDDVATPFGTYRHQLGGGATFVALAAALFAPTRLVSAVGDDFDPSDLASLASRGIDVSGVARLAGATHRWSGHYGPEMSDAETVVNDVGVLAGWRPVVEGLRAGDVLYVGSLDPRLQLDVVRRVPAGVVTIFDTQGHWIAQDRDAVLRACAACGVACLTEAEVRALTRGDAAVDGARALLDLGVTAVAVKRGAGGAALSLTAGTASWPALPLDRVEDPTGSGDAFAGGLAGHLARTGRADPQALADAVEYGIACASVVAGRAAGRRLPDWSLADIETRRGTLRGDPSGARR